MRPVAFLPMMFTMRRRLISLSFMRSVWLSAAAAASASMASRGNVSSTILSKCARHARASSPGCMADNDRATKGEKRTTSSRVSEGMKDSESRKVSIEFMGRPRQSILAKSARSQGECRAPHRCWRSFALQFNAFEAPLSEDRGFTLTIRQLFQGAKPPERHRPYKVCAADLFPVPPCFRNSAS